MSLHENWRSISTKRTFLHYVLVTLLCFNIYWLMKKEDTTEMSAIIHFQPYSEDDISCHIIEDAALPTINTSITTDKRIFFMETSCKGGIDSRQACAIESAARANPNWRIEPVLFGPAQSIFLKGSIFKALQKFDNIFFARENLIDFTKQTPLDSLLSLDFIHLSKSHKVEHVSDLLRFLTLYKFGGVYLDLDVIVVKSFDTLANNWLGRQSVDMLGAGAIGFSNDKLGRQVANFSLLHIVRTFNPFLWDDSSVGVLRRVLENICGTENVTDMSKEKCQGFEVYDSVYFYPVPFTVWQNYLEQKELTLVDTYSAYTHHMWNVLAQRSSIPRQSRYAKLARRFCPTVYNMYKDEFGS